jgi:tetratricopeptide (TPR) repeat protein
LGVWFFLILAPTSSFVPIKDAAFEHRMYLPLAAVATGVVVGGWIAGQRLVRGGRVSRRALQVAGCCVLTFTGVILGILTFQRNVVYQSELSIWEDAVAGSPRNERAHNGVGLALARRQRMDEAMVQYRKALELNPNYCDAHNNLGLVLADLGRIDEAMDCYHKALEIDPNQAQAHNNLGAVLVKCGRVDEALAEFHRALQIEPDYAEAHDNLGAALAKNEHIDEAVAEYQRALEIEPDHANAHYNLGIVLAKRGEYDEAIDHFQKALQAKPDDADARRNLGIARSQQQGVLNSLAARRELLQSRPYDLALLNDIAWTLATNPNASIRNGAEAVELAQRAVQLSDGREPAVLGTLAAAQAEAGRFLEAVQTAREALELATQQDNSSLAESIKAKIPLYEARTPFRAMPQPVPAGSTQP